MLRLIREDLPAPEVSVLVESPVPGVVLIEAVLDRHDAPLHWRAGLWDKPPLDVSLRPDGRLAAVQFVLQDEKVSPGGTVTGDTGGPRGRWPVFDVDAWPDDRYFDEEMEVCCERAGNSLVLGFGSERAYRWARVDDSLALGLRSEGEVRGMVLALDAEVWDAIDASSFA